MYPTHKMLFSLAPILHAWQYYTSVKSLLAQSLYELIETSAQLECSDDRTYAKSVSMPKLLKCVQSGGAMCDIKGRLSMTVYALKPHRM